jgi:hypothetical protein
LCYTAFAFDLLQLLCEAETIRIGSPHIAQYIFTLFALNIYVVDIKYMNVRVASYQGLCGCRLSYALARANI